MAKSAKSTQSVNSEQHAYPDKGTKQELGANAETSAKFVRPSPEALSALKPYIKRYPGMLVATIAALIIAAAATLSVPIGARLIIDHGFGATSAESANIDFYFKIFILIGAVLAFASAARFYCVYWLGERLVSDLRNDVFAHLSRLSPSFYDKNHSGEIMSRLASDATLINTAIRAAVSQALRNMVVLVGGIIMMFVTSPQLSGLVVLAIPLIILPLVFYGRAVKKLSRKAQDRLADVNSLGSETLSSIRTVQGNNAEERISRRFAKAIEEAFGASLLRMRARAGLTAIAIFMVFTSVVGILWYGAHAVLAGELSRGLLGQFVLYAVFAAGAMGELTEVWGEITQASGAAERLGEFLIIKPDIENPQHPIKLPLPVTGNIAFRQVDFAYPTRPDEQVLTNISFEVKSGERVAIVGASGAGKTTLFQLLMRFYDTSNGKVTLEGVPVNHADLYELRDNIAFVSQDIVMFDDTIAENIRFARPNASDEDVIAAARQAHAHEFISDLTDGYQARIGERGQTLSGGQRQRLGLARALLKDAPILLLDEATSALDAESEMNVQAALDEVMVGRTTLVIAHRLATVQKADRLIVLEGSKIAEIGSHGELMARDGIYARLARLQFTAEAAE